MAVGHERSTCHCNSSSQRPAHATTTDNHPPRATLSAHDEHILEREVVDSKRASAKYAIDRRLVACRDRGELRAPGGSPGAPHPPERLAVLRWRRSYAGGGGGVVVVVAAALADGPGLGAGCGSP